MVVGPGRVPSRPAAGPTGARYVSHSVFGPCGIQVVEMVWVQGFVVCTVAVSLCRPPCYPVQDRSPDGAGPLPAWRQPCMNEIILPAGAVLCHPHCVSCSLDSKRKRDSHVSHTAGGEEAAGGIMTKKNASHYRSIIMNKRRLFENM